MADRPSRASLQALCAELSAQNRQLRQRLAELEALVPQPESLTPQQAAGRQADGDYLRMLAQQGRHEEALAFARHLNDPERPACAVELEDERTGADADSLRMLFYSKELRQRAYLNWYNSPDGGPDKRTPECLRRESTTPISEIPRQWLDPADYAYVLRLAEHERGGDDLVETLNSVHRANAGKPPKPPEPAKAERPRKMTAAEVAAIHAAQLAAGAPLLEVDWDEVQPT